MARVGTHLNFNPQTEEAFDFYRSVFWGDYFGSLTDRFGVCWMFNCASRS